jgi:hypothetical protein
MVLDGRPPTIDTDRDHTLTPDVSADAAAGEGPRYNVAFELS